MRAPLKPVHENVPWPQRDASLKHRHDYVAPPAGPGGHQGPVTTQPAPAPTTTTMIQDEDDHLADWRRRWLRIMNTAVVYFDDTDEARQGLVQDHLARLQTKVQRFFDANVTHVVSDHGSSPASAKARELGIKVYNFEKMCRFLGSLLGYPVGTEFPQHVQFQVQQPQQQQQKLTEMLQEESRASAADLLSGSRREDFHRFRGPYVLVWDPTWHNRPLLHREWARSEVPAAGEWPQLRNTPAGTCPFAPRPQDSPISIKRTRSQSTTLSAPSKRRALAEIQPQTQQQPGQRQQNHPEIAQAEVSPATITPEPQLQPQPQPQPQLECGDHNGDTSSDSANGEENGADTQARATVSFVAPGGPTGPHTASFQRAQFGEIAASGMQRWSGTSATRSTTQSGDMVGPRTTASREVASLQRKVFNSRPSPAFTPPATANTTASASGAPPAGINEFRAPQRHKSSKPRGKERKAGFCENCLERFDDFEKHVRSLTHRQLAEDKHRYAALDSIIDALRRRPRDFEEDADLTEDMIDASHGSSSREAE